MTEESPYTVALLTDPSDADREFVAAQLREFNNRVSPHHKAIRTEPDHPLAVFVRDADGTILAGLTASTFWGWLDIDKFWISERLRGQGLGRRLLQMAEDEARRRGCLRACLDTFSFQARGFYEKQGYRVVGQMDDFPPGSTQFWMRKDFDHAETEHGTMP